MRASKAGALVLYALVFVAGGVTSLVLDRWIPLRALPALWNPRGERVGPGRPVDPAIPGDSTVLFTDDDALFSYVKRFGPARTLRRLSELAPLPGSCHDPAHKAGRFAYELLKQKAFQSCSAECHSGCYHGAVEAYFKEHGTADLSKQLRLVCGSELRPFFAHQCFHGVGHGLMAWAGYELLDALEACEHVPEKWQVSCWTGVFMENIVGALGAKEGHASRYLSDDPHYPCTVVADKYKFSCYFLQTSRMMQVFSGDFARIAAACLGAPERYRRACFESMGRDVGGVHRRDVPQAIAACSHAPAGELRTGCLIGAAQDTFWTADGQDTALRFCGALKEEDEKDACYRVIVSRARVVLASQEELTSFCSRVEAQHRNTCPGFLNSD